MHGVGGQLVPNLSICYDHDVFVAQKRGGVPRYFIELAGRLASAGRVSISLRSPIFVSDGVAELAQAGVRVAGMHVPVFPGVSLLGNILAKALPGQNGGDIAHATWYPTVRPKRCRYFAITVHDMIAELFPDQVRGASLQVASKAVAARNADLIFCVSNQTKNDVMRLLGVPEWKIRVTPLASVMGDIAPARFTVDAPYILFVGNRQGYKNFDSLAAAYSSSPLLRRNFKFLCFGGPSFGSEAASLRALGIEQIHGDDRLLAAAYREAALYVCPSRYEGFGLPVMEAMSCGCPVLAGRLGSLPEIGADAIAYVEEVTTEAIRDEMEKVLFDPNRLRLLKRAGIVRSRAFSWAKTAEETLNGYVALAQ